MFGVIKKIVSMRFGRFHIIFQGSCRIHKLSEPSEFLQSLLSHQAFGPNGAFG
jgi:hypothetical protein